MYVEYVTALSDYNIKGRISKNFMSVFKDKLEPAVCVERVKANNYKFRKNENLEIQTWWL